MKGYSTSLAVREMQSKITTGCQQTHNENGFRKLAALTAGEHRWDAAGGARKGQRHAGNHSGSSWKTSLQLTHEQLRSRACIMQKQRRKFPKAFANIYSSFISNRQKLETIQIFLTGEWPKQLWCIPNMEQNSARKRSKHFVHTTASMNLQRITLSEKNSILKCYILYDFTYGMFLKQPNYRNGEQINGCQRWRWGAEGEKEIKRQHEGS